MNWWLSFVAFVFAFLRIRCKKPRLRPGTASMAPQIIRDRLEHLYCNRFKHHLGPCEAKRFVIDPHDEDDGKETWRTEE